MTRSIIKDSSKLRDAFKKRWKQLKRSQQLVADDAVLYGQSGITRQGISKYLTSPYSAGALNDEQIIWLAYRYSIYVMLTVGVPDVKVKYAVPEEFDNEKAIKELKKIFDGK